jgi:brefeldin A-inhibited guanine nucleotide-exchange protein
MAYDAPQVFTTAATDKQRSIVALAFETIEKIVREYFSHITETETATFTDCVNCLTAFTNSHFNMDISLNAIAFLRFCALRLAEGSIGQLQLPEADTGTPSP